jgi:uncharacterized protein YjgD (DUF1641 family)
MSDEQTADQVEGTNGQGETPVDAVDGAVPPELVNAIEENPEQVARLIQNLDQVNELLDASAVVTASMDDGMLMRVSDTGANLGAAADEAATPELADLGESVGQNAEEMTEAVETIVELQESGTLDDVAEFAHVISLLEGAMDDEMIMSVAGAGSRLGEVVETAGDEEVAGGLESVLQAVGDATSEEPDEVGIIGLARALRDPEVRAGMGVALNLLQALGQSVSDPQQ